MQERLCRCLHNRWRTFAMFRPTTPTVHHCNAQRNLLGIYFNIVWFFVKIHNLNDSLVGMRMFVNDILVILVCFCCVWMILCNFAYYCIENKTISWLLWWHFDMFVILRSCVGSSKVVVFDCCLNQDSECDDNHFFRFDLGNDWSCSMCIGWLCSCWHLQGFTLFLVCLFVYLSFSDEICSIFFAIDWR